MSEKLFTEPKIKIGKKSYVWFRYFDSETSKLRLVLRKPGGLKDASKQEIKTSLKALRDALSYKLNYQGWNPFTGDTTKEETELPLFIDGQINLNALLLMSFNRAIDFAYSEKLPDWSKKTSQDYASSCRYIKKAAKQTGIESVKVTELRRAHYINLLKRITDNQKLGAKGFNKYRVHLSTLLSKLEEYEVIEYNPIKKIKPKQEIKTFAHRPPTKAERALIVKEIREKIPAFYTFCSFVYACSMRPKEILQIQIKDIDFVNQMVRIEPAERALSENPDQAKAKTKLWRRVPIPNWLFQHIADIAAMDKDLFLFSKNYKPGRKPLSINRPGATWKKVIKDGLALDVDLYSLKKLGGNDMVRMQVKSGLINLLEVPKLQRGHTSSRMTEVYVTEHINIINKFIRENMPEL